MSQTTNGPTLNSPTHHLSIQRDSGFVPLALLVFICLAGIAAWLGQPMLCDLCIAEIFFIGNQVARTKTLRGVASQPQSIQVGHLDVNIAQKEVQAEILEIVERGQLYSEKAAIPESHPSAIQPISASPSDKITTSEVITIASEEVVTESPKVLDLPEEEVTVNTAPTEISERVENTVPSVPTSSISLSPNVKVPTPVPAVAPIETQISEPVASNPVPERVECITKKGRHVSFATPPTPPVSPPRESFAIPADYSMEAEEPHQKIKTEEEKQLRDQIREAFEDDMHMPVVTHIEGIAEKQSDEIKTKEAMENSMVVIPTEATSESSATRQESKASPPDTPQLTSRTEEIEPSAISLSQGKPTLIILTPETEESRVIFDANNSRLPSFDAQVPVTPSMPALEAVEEKIAEETVAEVVATPMIAEKAVARIPSLARSCGIVFTDPFSPYSPEKKAEEETERVETIVQQIHDVTILSPKTQLLGDHSEAIRGPYIEPGYSEDETSSTPVPASDTKTSDELKVETTQTRNSDNTVVKGVEAEKAIPEFPQKVIPGAATKIISEETQKVIVEAAEKIISGVTQNVIPEAAEGTIPEATQMAISKAVPSGVTEVATFDAAPGPPPKAIEVVEFVKVAEEVNTPQAQSKTIPTLLVTTPMIPEDEELVILERKTEDVARPRSSGSKFPSRPSTAKSSGSDAGGSSSSIDVNGTSSSIQRSASTGSVRFRSWLSRKFSQKGRKSKD
ncbi:hypothetical protein BGX38DRAFT_484786 [Terfezia claveryi]|nr:hypothetical protein BGX38DRAFT_484786 [Terfezia claveryi]